MAGGDQPQWPPGFTPGVPDPAQQSVVRRPPVIGAPATDVPPATNSLWPPGFTPGQTSGTTAAPEQAPEATSQTPPAGRPGAPAAHEPTWGEAFGAMVSPTKIKESGVKLAQDIAEGVSGGVHKAVADPVGTLAGIGKKGFQTLAMPAAEAIIPFLSDEKKELIKKVMGGWAPEGNPMVQQLIDRYGSLDKLKKTMAEDPAGTWLDVATIFSGGEAAAARAGLTTTSKVLGVGSRIDPITLASRGIPELKIPGLEAAASKAIPKTLGWRSGVGPEVVSEIKDLHKPGSDAWNKYGAAGPNEFDAAFKGGITPSQIVDRAEEGVKNMKKDAGAAYGLSKQDWIQQGGTFDFKVIEDAQLELKKSLHSSGGIDALNKKERKRFGDLMDFVDGVRARGNWAIDDMDMLARRMQNFTTGFTDHPQMQRVAGEMKKAVRDSIYANAPPSYREGLKNYHAAMNDIDELKSALSLGKDASEHTVMSKLQSILRNNAATQYGGRQQLVDILEREGNVRLKPWLLGMATNVDAPRGITGAMAAGSGSGAGIGAGAGLIFGGPAGAAAGAATGAIAGLPISMAELYARSPRNAARVGRTMGEYGDDFSSAFPLARYGAVSTGHADREEDLKKPPPPQRRARGGRIGYADGGEVEDLDSLAVNPAVGRVKRSYFTPIGVTGTKIAPSKAIMGSHPAAVPMPQLPSLSKPQAAASGDGTGGALETAAKLWNAPFEQKRAQEKTAEEAKLTKLREEALALQKAQAGAGTGAATAAAAAPGTTPGGGVLQGTPIPGDSYEAKVGGFESGSSDTAVNKTSGAAGRFQFMPSTAAGIIKANPHLNITENWRTNPEDQQKLMKVYTDTSRDLLRKTLGREPTGGELYALHLFGHGKGPSIVAGGNAPLVSLTSEAERSGNPFLNNFKTAADLLTYFNKRFG